MLKKGDWTLEESISTSSKSPKTHLLKFLFHLSSQSKSSYFRETFLTFLYSVHSFILITFFPALLSSNSHRALLVDHFWLRVGSGLWEKSSPNLNFVKTVGKRAPFSSDFLHSFHSLVRGDVLGQTELSNRHVIDVVTFAVLLLLSWAEIGVRVTTLVVGFGWGSSEPICKTGSCWVIISRFVASGGQIHVLIGLELVWRGLEFEEIERGRRRLLHRVSHLILSLFLAGIRAFITTILPH